MSIKLDSMSIMDLKKPITNPNLEEQIFQTSPQMSLVGDAHQKCFASQAIFQPNDLRHIGLHQFFGRLFETPRTFVNVGGRQPEAMDLQPNNPAVQNSNQSSFFILTKAKKDFSLNDFSLLEFALKSIKQSKNKLSAEEQVMLDLPDLDSINPKNLYIYVTKDSKTKQPHVDSKFKAVWSLAIPSLTETKTPANRQTTMYQIKNHLNFNPESNSNLYQNLPIGEAMVMFPKAYPLKHVAPNIEKEGSQIGDERYFIAVGIYGSNKELKGDQEDFKTMGIEC